MIDSFDISTFFPGIPATKIFHAWMESGVHSGFAGSPAQIEPGVDGVFSAWDGFISSRTLEIEPHHRILQSRRTTEFPEGSPDSRLEILFEERERNAAEADPHPYPGGAGRGLSPGLGRLLFRAYAAVFFCPEDIIGITRINFIS